jgi:hypothetical protein
MLIPITQYWSGKSTLSQHLSRQQFLIKNNLITETVKVS